MNIYLDTETTGLGHTDKIVEIAIVDENENVLLNSLVNPQRWIGVDATRIHGIDADMVANAPTMDELAPQIIKLMDTHPTYIYNKAFDLKMLAQSSQTMNLYLMAYPKNTVHCLMKKFSRIYGDWSDYRNDYRWQSLDVATRYYSVVNPMPHRALGDALSACRVHKGMRTPKRLTDDQHRILTELADKPQNWKDNRAMRLHPDWYDYLEGSVMITAHGLVVLEMHNNHGGYTDDIEVNS